MSIQKREGKLGTKWLVRYRDHDGTQRTETYSLKSDAKRRDFEIRRQMEIGATHVVEARRTTLADYVTEHWGPEHADQLAPKTREDYLGAWHRRLKPELGNVPLAHITVRTVKEWQARQYAEAQVISQERESDRLVGQVAIERARCVLSSILSHAAEEGLIVANPVRVVRRIRGRRDATGAPRHPEPMVIPDPLQVETLRIHLDDHDSAFVAVLAYAGLRPSEAWGLRWEDLDNERLRVWASKTGRQRYVMIREPLAAYLEEWNGISAETGRDPELMFDARDHRAWVRRHFRPAVAAAGLPSRTRPYDLRHTCASLLVAEHRSVVEAAEWMGHAPTLFLNTYAHVMERHRGGGRLDVDQAIRQARIAAEAKPVWSDSDQIPLLEGESSSRRGDSNPRPPVYKTGALTS